MEQGRWQAGRSVAIVAAGLMVGVTALAQPSADRWWIGYGNGADN
jgi:hypothetical protein